jgi:hypothetical protein
MMERNELKRQGNPAADTDKINEASAIPCDTRRAGLPLDGEVDWFRDKWKAMQRPLE